MNQFSHHMTYSCPLVVVIHGLEENLTGIKCLLNDSQLSLFDCIKLLHLETIFEIGRQFLQPCIGATLPVFGSTKSIRWDDNDADGATVLVYHDWSCFLAYS